MILNVHFNQFLENGFVFEGPYIFLEKHIQYRVGIKMIHIEFASSNEIRNECELWALCSNLVDQTAYNTKQSLLYFTMNEYSARHFKKQASVSFYPLEKHQLDFPRFWLERISPHTDIGKINSVFLQIEIQEKCGGSVNH